MNVEIGGKNLFSSILVLVMKNIFYLFIFLPIVVFAQEWQLQKTIPLKADRFIGVDSYQHIYWIKGREVYKQLGEEVYSFSDTKLGGIHSVDITNPLTVLVFYYSSQTLVVLDNKFNEIDRIVFSKMPEFMDVMSVGNAGSRQLWIGNTATQRLEVFNYRNKHLEASSPIFSGEILQQTSEYNVCYIRTSKHIYMFNSYGSVLQKIPAKSYKQIFPANKGVVLQTERQWYYWDKEFAEPRLILIDLQPEGVKNLFYSRQMLYVFDGKHLHTYIAEK